MHQNVNSKRSLSISPDCLTGLFFKGPFRAAFSILMSRRLILIYLLFFLSPSAAEVFVFLHLVEGDGVFPLKVVPFEAGEGQSASAQGAFIVVLPNVLFDGLPFEVGPAAVGEGGFLWDLIREWTRILPPLRLKELKSGDLSIVLLEIESFFNRSVFDAEQLLEIAAYIASHYFNLYLIGRQQHSINIEANYSFMKERSFQIIIEVLVICTLLAHGLMNCCIPYMSFLQSCRPSIVS